MAEEHTQDSAFRIFDKLVDAITEYQETHLKPPTTAYMNPATLSALLHSSYIPGLMAAGVRLETDTTIPTDTFSVW
jgi:hypothetical protein